MVESPVPRLSHERGGHYDHRVAADSGGDAGRQIWVGSIVIRCRRFDEMLAQRPPQDGWVILTDPSGKGPNISLDRCEDPPPLGETSRVHIDFYTDDSEREVERLLSLGATRYEREARPDDDFVVLVDPDGNRFCVVE
jgi:Glyoxalase-like domain